MYSSGNRQISSIELLKVSIARCTLSQHLDRAVRETPADCFQASKFKLDGWESTPGATGKASAIGDGLADWS
ncbi:hypothetical protein [Microcoleus sp. herbarium14]|uniref:hypothetical protein n=1 Tax=Microcoleus sp. herbarium14 TaxID=3055439 RepID=UPI002FD047A6